ncbi:MAG: hypothetical protein LAP39_15330 [Acidobacteriia bacterium]|nr:hypothetical protein [Terriglobia bacterium]
MANSKNASALINIRKLAALDIAFHGPKFILAEFGTGVFLFAACGLFTLFDGIFRRHSGWEVIWAGYLLALGINYVPLLRYAVVIARQRSAKEEAAGEMAHKAKHALQSLLLLIPLVVPALAMAQESRRARKAADGCRVDRPPVARKLYRLSR